MRWLRRLLGIPPAPIKTFDHTECFSPDARKWIEQNKPAVPLVTPTSFEERDTLERRRRADEAERRRQREAQRRRDDDDLIITSAYAPVGHHHTPSKTYSTGGHDHRDHCTPTTHDTGYSHSDGGSCGGDGGGGGGGD